MLGTHRLIVDLRVIEDDLALAQEEPARSWVCQMTRIEHTAGCLQFDGRIEAISGGVRILDDTLRRSETQAKQNPEDDLAREKICRHQERYHRCRGGAASKPGGARRGR